MAMGHRQEEKQQGQGKLDACQQGVVLSSVFRQGGVLTTGLHSCLQQWVGNQRWLIAMANHSFNLKSTQDQNK
jgi:hypothetical protein